MLVSFQRGHRLPVDLFTAYFTTPKLTTNRKNGTQWNCHRATVNTTTSRDLCVLCRRPNLIMSAVSTEISIDDAEEFEDVKGLLVVL